MRELSVNEIFGGSVERKRDVKKFYSEIFELQNFSDIKERDKTKDELLMIDLVNKETNKLLDRFGIEHFDISAKNIHVLEKEAAIQYYKKMGLPEGTYGSFDPARQAIFLKEEGDMLFFMKNLAHEMSHIKSYQSAQIFSRGAEKPLITDRRFGLSIQLRNKENRRAPSGKYAFSDLDEAVIDVLANRLVRDILESADLPEKLNYLRKRYKEDADKLFERSYFAYKLRFWDMVTRIYEKHKDEFSSPNEVFEVFAEAIFKKKKFLEVGKLIESTFGKHGFRIIGESGMPESEIKKSTEE